MALFSPIKPSGLQIENADVGIIMNEDGTAQVQVGATELGQERIRSVRVIVGDANDSGRSDLTVSSQDTDTTPMITELMPPVRHISPAERLKMICG